MKILFFVPVGVYFKHYWRKTPWINIYHMTLRGKTCIIYGYTLSPQQDYIVTVAWVHSNDETFPLKCPWYTCITYAFTGYIKQQHLVLIDNFWTNQYVF